MSGILEQILAELQVIKATLAGATSVQPAAPITPYQAPAAANGGGALTPAPAPAPVDPFAAAPTPADVTEAQVMSLIEPHLDNAPLKAGLSAVLTSMGIARLPEARPDQYATLYKAFQQVIAQHAAVPAAQPTSII